MTPRRFTLRTSHLVMWSSPLLLLILVFTLNSRPLHTATNSTSTSTSSSSSLLTGPRRDVRTTTSTLARDHPSTTTQHPRPATSTSASSPPRVVATTVSSSPNSFTATPTSAATIALVGVVVRSGTLTLAAPAAVFPLRGPGRWSLANDHAVAATLECAGISNVVIGVVRVSTPQTCQLVITIATSAPTTWTLRATR